MNINGLVWREAKDEMGRSVWINMSLARTVRRDPKSRGTLVTFDHQHSITVETAVNDLMSAAPAPAMRPRDFDIEPTRARSRSGRVAG
jgi:hypothetical protein